ncbi:hypothetical protein GCM10017576_11100 [Microbacterium barkeri]|uniref:Aromatic amino acid lyase n=1 Tax=Microbacterium barkeri TaxID=33917 RepID=A0A9W6H255_9MICO|nr:aromatic amino acid lyase [Microbacterium barkeri]MDI6942981.1 aromatic amino acid lyase [Microbacterium barkeri]MDR6876516.1 histidine ammonia-lyase [Microbacterium barkeri]GLJ60981.1 hypothetical protein GCM10017576_11100 [Microbacterium barkeri]
MSARIAAAAAEIARLLEHGMSSDAQDRIARERGLVEQLMAGPGRAPIYGFTTLLGHLDDVEAVAGAQRELLAAHLVGPLEHFPPEWGALLLDVKLAQLAQGSSGIHPETHALLVSARADFGSARFPASWTGNWTASYSSGDVVPGAWFVHVLEQAGLLHIHRAGDLISIINGHFVSTSAGLAVAAQLSGIVDELLDLVCRAVPKSPDRGVQLPVTLRDLQPIRLQAENVVFALVDTLRSRLEHPSGNPLFIPHGTGVRAVSQSSFLDFRLTGALGQAVQLCAQIAAYAKAAVVYATDSDERGASARVQPAKIAEALIRQLSLLAVPQDFAFAESHGVEDVGDLSLESAGILARGVQILDSLADLVADAVHCVRAPSADALRLRVPSAGIAASLVS